MNFPNDSHLNIISYDPFEKMSEVEIFDSTSIKALNELSTKSKIFMKFEKHPTVTTGAILHFGKNQYEGLGKNIKESRLEATKKALEECNRLDPLCETSRKLTEKSPISELNEIAQRSNVELLFNFSNEVNSKKRNLFKCNISFLNYSSSVTCSSKKECREKCSKDILQQIKNSSEEIVSQRAHKLKVINSVDEYSPRDYQEEIYNKALNSNIIACLATGTGKTFIAVMLIKKYSEQTFKQFPNTKKIVFLVTTVALVFQQSDYIRRHTNLRIGSFYGENSFGIDENSKWRAKINECNILIMTAEILRQLLQYATVDISEICLLIFDECHHGINKGHPYNVIMTLYYAKNRSLHKNVPRILGLSASPALNIKINSLTLNDIRLRIEQLEKIFDSQCITSLEHLESLKSFTANPQINIIIYREEENNVLINSLSTYLNEYKQKMDNFCSKIFSSMGIISGIDEIKHGVQLVSKYGTLILTSIKVQKSIAKCFINCEKVLQEFGIFALNIFIRNIFLICNKICKHEKYEKFVVIYQKFYNYLLEMQDYIKFKISYILEKMRDKSIESLCCTPLVTHKLQSLLLLICKHYSLNSINGKKDETVSTLVFTTERSSSAILSDVLNEFAIIEGDSLKISQRITSTYVVGASMQYYHQKLSVGVIEINLKVINERLERFHHSHINIMFATNVLEEGIDVRSCNIVIRFDKFSTLHSFIQSKGRIRQKQAIFYVFSTEKNAYGIKSKIHQMKSAEDSIENLLSKYCVEEIDLKGDINYFTELPLEEHKLITTLTEIDLRAATSYIYQYCDKYSNKSSYVVKPRYFFEYDDNKIRCCLKMPVECSISEIICSDWVTDKKLGKQHCSLRAIKMLYKLEKINHNLLPFKYSSNNVRSPAEVFTKKEVPVNFYKKSIPSALKNTSNIQNFLFYTIEFSEFTTCKSKEKIYSNINLQNPEIRIGLLTPGNISSVSFPLASSVFSLQVNIIPINNGKITLTSDQLSLIKQFNKALYCDFLDVMPSSCCWSPDNGHYIIFIVIFDLKNEINFKLMQQIISYTMLTPEKISSNLTVSSFDRNKLNGLLIMKNYSEDKSIFYIKNQSDYNVNSLIPNSEESFKQYFFKKWSKTLKDDEIMVECFKIGLNSLNLLNNVFSFQTREKNGISLPLTCVIPLPFSLEYIFKLRSIPSIIKRLLDFLIIEEWCMDKIEISGLDKIDSSSIDSFVHKTSISLQSSGKIKLGDKFSLSLQFYKSLDHLWNDSLNISHNILFKSVFQALTRVSSNECCNYERMENLGDSLLKFIISMVVFILNPNSNEGNLTSHRDKLVSNKFFYQIGTKIGVDKVINSKFTVFGSNWCPPCSIVKKETFNVLLNDTIMYQYIPEKSIADVVESLVGCCLISSDISKVYEFLMKLNIFNDKRISECYRNIKNVKKAFSDLKFEYSNINNIINDIRSVEEIIKYNFTNKNIIAQAITHVSSISDKRQQSYERLELLGDSIIGFLVTYYLYILHDMGKFKSLSPYLLTHLQHALVNNKIFALISSKSGLVKSMKLNSYELHSAISHSLNCIENLDETDNFEEIPFLGLIFKPKINIFDSYRSIIVEVVNLPKPLSDLFEAIIGAVFIDSNCDLVLTAKKFISMIENKIEQYLDIFPIHPKIYQLENHKSHIKNVTILSNKKYKVTLKHPDHSDEYIGIANNIDDAHAASCYGLMKFGEEK